VVDHGEDKRFQVDVDQDGGNALPEGNDEIN
jgi:hypothetical protein